jgi:hypothetical protein
MEQLLNSIKLINAAKQTSDRHVESHIFFDNGVRGTQLTEFALQLVSIAKPTLGNKPAFSFYNTNLIFLSGILEFLLCNVVKTF